MTPKQAPRMGIVIGSTREGRFGDAALDGLLAITQEYSHGPSAVSKNAFDYA